MMQTKIHSIYSEIYELSPKSLQDICLEIIIKNLTRLTSFRLIQKGEAYKKEVFFTQDTRIPCKIAERLLEEFSLKGALRNDTLSIFSDSSLYNIKVLKLIEISMATGGQELLNYSSFRLNQLELGCKTALNRWSINKLKSSFIGSSHSLVSLKLHLFPAVTICSGNIFDFLIQFPNLRYLYYETPIHGNGQTFTNENWKMLLTSCSKLKAMHFVINGSAKDIELDSSLFLKSASLQRISLCNAFKSELALQSVDFFLHFPAMDNLRYIDFSIDSDPNDVNQPFQYNDTNSVEMLNHTDVLAEYINRFLRMAVGKLLFLESLDLSGIFRLDDDLIQKFIDSHCNLHFLGLCMIDSKFCRLKDVVNFYEHVKIAGCFIETQIITSLLKYPNRPTYMREVFKGLFQISAGWEKRRPFIVKMVIDIMEKFKGHQNLQMAGTACLFNLSKEREGIDNELNIALSSEIANITRTVLLLYIGNLEIVKNCLLIICTNRILHSAKFDRMAMSRLCLNCMLKYQENEDRHVTRMAVAIVSILACKISSNETAKLITEKEMKLLLHIVEVRIQEQRIDSTLKFNLSALWNLTDESPQACKLFFELDGLTKYGSMLEIFTENEHIETKVLGLLNNLAEVRFLQNVLLLNERLIDRVKQLMGSKHLSVSYFACGIIANLALHWEEYETCLDLNMKSAVLKELEKAIESFGVPKQEIVTYRSFKPFYELLKCHNKLVIQQWAVWAIHHVCTLDSTHYKELMTDECLMLLNAVRTMSSSAVVYKQINEIYEALDK